MSDIVIMEDDKWSESKDTGKWGLLSKKEEYTNILDKINDYLLESQSIKTKDKVVFYRMLATMVNAWISILKAITILEEQETNLVLKKVLWNVRDSLKEGSNFSETMQKFPNNFSEAEVWIIESWEKTWKLNTALLTLADQVEKVESMSGKIKSALMYPGMIITVVFWVIIVLMVFVVPKLLEIFEDATSLPLSTRILIAISDFLRDYYYVLIWFIIMAVIWLGIRKKTPKGRYNWDLFMLHMPVFGDIIRKVVLWKFARVLAWLMSSWVSIVESLRITAAALWNEVYKERVMLLRQDIQKWLKLWEWLDWDPLFPIMLVQMIQVWEQTAQVDKIIVKIADFYDEEVNNKVWMINKLLEPFIIVFMAVVVWFIAVSIMQPIMQLADTVSSK